MSRRLVSAALGAAAAVAVLAMAAPAAAADGVSRDEAIVLLDATRDSIDETLSLIKSGDVERALAEAKSGYLAHFELVETPLRIADNDLTVKAEFQFAAIRTAIQDGRSIESIVAFARDTRELRTDSTA